MSRGPGRVQRRIVEALKAARTVEPWPVFVTVHGLAVHAYEVEAPNRAQIEAVRRAANAMAGVELWRWQFTAITDRNSLCQRERWIAAARLTPTTAVENDLFESWFNAPYPGLQGLCQARTRELDIRGVDFRVRPADDPAYRPPDPWLLAVAVEWRLRYPGRISVDGEEILRTVNAYAGRTVVWVEAGKICVAPTLTDVSDGAGVPRAIQHLGVVA